MRRENKPNVQTSLKSAVFVGSALKDLKKFPREVQGKLGFAIHQAQLGEKAANAKPIVTFPGAGVLEVVEDFRSDTYRAVYTVRLEGYVFVLHCFQKKSKRGIATTQQDNDLIERRYKDAVDLHAKLTAQEKNP